MSTAHPIPMPSDPILDANDDPASPTAAEIAALHHLAAVALGTSGQAHRCANFLLAWANADAYGAFDPTDLWACDPAAIAAMVAVFGLIARIADYPDTLDPSITPDLRAIAAKWRRRPGA